MKTQSVLSASVNPLIDRFQDRATAQLKDQQSTFQTIADPLAKSLAQISEHVRQLEATRAGAYEGLLQQVQEMARGQKDLQQETGKLVSALRTPHVRGSWGEMQLRRTVELAGMIEHCDFQEQVVPKGDKRNVRPDLIVYLPGGRSIIVDAKAPVMHYLEAASALSEEERNKKLCDHARLVSGHVKSLSEKEYWRFFENSLEFVILFLPGEAFLSAALEIDPGLLEFAAERNIVLATPASLISLLKTVCYGWRQEALSLHAQRIGEIGAELRRAIGLVDEQLLALGRILGNATTSYTKVTHLFHQHVRPHAEKLRALDALEPSSAKESIAQAPEDTGHVA